MSELPGKPVKCTRTLKVTIDDYPDLELEVPATFQSPIIGPDGFLRILDAKTGNVHLINPDFVLHMTLKADIETDMKIVSDDND